MTEVQGLTSEVAASLAAAGKINDVPRRSSRSVGEIVRANTFTRFNALIGSMFVLVIIFGQWQDALFGGIIVANTAIGIIQELRAKRTLDALAVVGETPVRIVRDGKVSEHPQQDIVLGDLLALGPGDKVVVDGTVARSAALEVDESLLTGEADPVHKHPGDPVMSGSFVVAGSGSFTAGKVGRDAYAARLVEEASRFSLAHSELVSGINTFLKYVTWLIIPVAALLIITQLSTTGSIGDAVVGAVAGVVTMVPEGLVLMTSIAFAVGVVRLGRRRCLVQELPAIEGLARIDVLCLDKTGTLTEPGMDLADILPLTPAAPITQALRSIVALEETPNPTLRAVSTGLPTPTPPVEPVVPTSGAATEHTTAPPAKPVVAPGSGTAAGRTSGVGDGAGEVWEAGVVVPFSSARKWSGGEFPGHGGWVMGAADVLLAPGEAARERAEELGAGGLRVLALCRVPEGALDSPDSLSGVTAVALLTLRQRLRAEAPATLAYFAEQGVAIKVISGDNPVSVGAIAGSLSVPGAEHPVDARTLPSDTAEMAAVLEENSVFGRVSPQQKRAMVKALQSRGHTVAMTGDGVNDVLALKDADLGVSMGSGSGATRAVAKIVLLDDNFASLPYVVAEGRRVLGNIERVANLFLTKTMYSIILAVLVGLLHVRFPFLPRHVTLISTLTIGIPAFFLALAPNTERARPGFVPRVLRFAIPAGIACGLATFLGYYLARSDPDSSYAQDSSSATLSLFLLAIWVLLLIAHPYNWWRLGLVAAMAGAFLVVLAVPWLSDFFALYPTDVHNDIVSLAIAAGAAVLLTAALRWDAWLKAVRDLFRRPAPTTREDRRDAPGNRPANPRDEPESGRDGTRSGTHRAR